IAVETSEMLSKRLKKNGIAHEVLNAKPEYAEREAETIAQAGRPGAVTIATNMAGRGVDIKLGGNAEELAHIELRKRNIDPEDENYETVFDEILPEFEQQVEAEREKAMAAGGLYVCGTERHESRRIDNQLRGRSGRQGDPGRSRFYISLEDDLMQRFGGDRIKLIMDRLGWEEGQVIDGRLISRSIETAQKRVESFHFDARKHVTEYDDVMNKQRQVIYNLRNRVLHGQDIRQEILDMVDDLLEIAVVIVCDEKTKSINWDLSKLEERFSFLFNTRFKFKSDIELDRQSIFDFLRKEARQMYERRVSDISSRLAAIDTILKEKAGVEIERSGGDKPFFDFEQHTILETMDHLWNVHLQEMDHLREGIGWRGYGQKNPLHEYQKEGFAIFQQLLDSIKEAVVRKLFFMEVAKPEDVLAQIEAEKRRREEMERSMRMIHDSPLEAAPQAAPQAGAQAMHPGQAPGGGAKQQPIRSPEEERQRLAAQKRARRKLKGA
ncbi:MAG: preprotein translocase subunit SecA, partial [Proteobacteria bacterium]